MSRFAADPRWLIYLPPTMSPARDQPRSRAAGAPGRGVRLLPRATAWRGWCARRSTWARGPWWSSAATRTRRARRFGVDRRRAARDLLHPHRPAVLRRRRRSEASCSTGCARPSTAAGLWDGAGRPTGCAWTAELMPWSAKAQELLRPAVRRRSGAAAPARLWPARARPRSTPARPRGAWTSPDARCARPRSAPDDWRAALRRRLPALLLAGAVARRPAAGAVPPAGQRGRGPRRARDHVWHMETLAAPGREPTAPLLGHAPTGSSTLTDAGESCGDGRRLVGGR